MARTLDLAKRTAIMAAARTIFIKDGYAAAKMSDIAAESGVAQGTLYLYFESKESLASAIGEEFIKGLMDHLATTIQAIEGPDGIIPLVEYVFEAAYTERVLLAMAKEHSAGARTKKEGRKLFVSKIAEALSELVTRGLIRDYGDPSTQAELVLAILRRAMMSYAVYSDENIAELKIGMITLLQHALFDDVTLTANKMLKQKRGAF